MKLTSIFESMFLLTSAALQIGSSPSEKLPDVTVTSGGEPSCTMSDEQLAQLKKRVKKILSAGIDKGFGDFPINRAKLLSKMASQFLTEKTICQALTAQSGATEQTHNEIREKYNGDCLSQKDAWEKGVVAKRLPLETSCPESYDWPNSPFYNEVETCEDVTAAIDSEGLPATMYVSDMEPSAVQSYLAKPAVASLYTKYANSGPIVCASGSNSQVAFHKIFVSKALPTLDYIMGEIRGSNWSAWNLLRTCTDENGNKYSAADLMFNFGMRVMAPITVEIDGHEATNTLIISSVAAAGTGTIGKIVPSLLSYRRFIAAEYAKSVLLEAKSNGWDIE